MLLSRAFRFDPKHPGRCRNVVPLDQLIKNLY